MPKYESFTQYLSIHYSKMLCDELAKFILREGRKESKRKNETFQYNGVQIHNGGIIGVKFTKSELEHVEFEVFIRVDYYLVKNNRSGEPTLVPGDGHLYSTHMRGGFNTGFEIGGGKTEKINKKPFTERLTKALVHVIDKEKMEQYATKFLKYYCPEALETPMALDLTKILNDKGVTWHSAPLTSGVFGKTYFADDVAEIYDENQCRKRVNIKRGTILINTIKADERGDGALRNTIVHEAVHWFYHNNYFGLRHLLNNEQTCAICYKSEREIDDEDIKWMESQARSLAPKILLPKKMFIKKFKEEYKHHKNVAKSLSNIFGMQRDAEILAETITTLASFFEVSKQSVKYRLIELGYVEADGVLNYNPDAKRYFTNYQFNKKKLSDHQTFHLSKESYLNLLESNQIISEAIRSRKLIYIGGLLVVNNPKYIINDKITDYAINHVDECCVIFNIKNDSKPFKEHAMTFALCAGGSSSKVQAEINDEQYAFIIKQADENAQHYERHKRKLPGTFGATIDYHCEKTGQSYEWIADICDITATTLRKFRNDDFDDIKLINIIKFGIGLKLSQPYIQDLINKSGISMSRVSKQNSILLAVITTFQRVGMRKVYKILKINGNEKYLKLSQRYMKKYILPKKLDS